MLSTSQVFTVRRPASMLISIMSIAIGTYSLTGCAGSAFKSGNPSTPSVGSSPAPLTITPQQSSIRIGQPDRITASVLGGTWSVQGGAVNGSIDSDGNFVAPALLPSNAEVSIQYRLDLQTVSTTITLLNPWPTLTSVSPSTLTSATNNVTVTGSGFLPTSQLLLNGTPIATQYIDSSHLSTVISIPGSLPPQFSLAVANPNPGAAISSAVTLALDLPMQVTPAVLAGGNVTITASTTPLPGNVHLEINGQGMGTVPTGSVTSIKAVGFLAPWITGTATVSLVNDQSGEVFATTQVPIAPTSVSFDVASRFATQAAFGPNLGVIDHIQQVGLSAFVDEQLAQPPVTTMDPNDSLRWFMDQAVDGNSLLRQRVAMGLQTFIPGSLPTDAYGSFIPWESKLEADAFGNYRQILLDALGDANVARLLTLPGSVASTDPNVHPNQNFAREILQQMSMGSNELNDDGSLVLDANGNPIPNYDENTINDASRMLTGWNYGPLTNPAFTFYNVDYSQSLVANESTHDTGPKTLFGSINIPAGQTAAQDRASYVEAIMSQQSTAPFVSRIMIQRLVKSNPSAAYIKRITQVFRDNGHGVSGDMAAVVKAILLDPEARIGDTTPQADDGALQDPLLFQLFVMNAIHLSNTDDQPIYVPEQIGENVWAPGTVFGYFSPNYMVPGTQINSPEFQVVNTNTIIGRSGALMWLLSAFNPNGTPQLQYQFTTVPQMVDAMNHILYHGTMPQYEQDAITSYCSSIQDPNQRFLAAAFIAMNSDNFSVNR